ncbi:hypothetical protein GCM10023258_34440 [Terrabacter aeriphilus]|uniref:Lipoyl-binding domain-containing protein n=1 Tax=Terrabacter aeriphilus TaxID=515662 RepID=A0ABP9JJE1_9MICO
MSLKVPVADAGAHGQVAAPFAGVVSLAVAVGDEVEAGAVVATIEAMKLEAGITSPVAGSVSRVAIGAQQQVEGGDLLVVIGAVDAPRRGPARPTP